LIIVNDASPENIENIVTTFSDKRIKYYKNDKNIGAEHVVDNWNKCLSYAQGEFILLIGDDDMLTPNCLQEYSALINKYLDFNVFHCRSIIIDENDNALRLTNTRPTIESVYDSIIERMNGRISFIGDYLFRTTALKKIGGFFYLPLAWGTDDITSYILAIETGTVHTNEPLFFYRENDLTISNTGNVKNKINAINEQAKWLKTFLLTPPKDTLSMISWTNLKNDIDLYMKKNKIRTIYTSLSDGTTNIFYWLINKKHYYLSNKELIYSFILSLKEKYK
jgi:hypothetical protein